MKTRYLPGARRLSLALAVAIGALAGCGPTVPPDQKASVAGGEPAPLVPPPAAVSPAPAAPSPAAPSPADLPPEDACGASRYAGLIGKPLGSDAPAASADVRHIRPDTQVTMDFRAERLNIDVSAEGVVTAVRCG